MGFATWNPSDKGSAVTLSGGNLTGSSAELNGTVRATIGKSAGKWYWEISYGSGTYTPGIGVAKSTATLTHYLGTDANGWGYYSNEGKKYNNAIASLFGSIATASGVVGIALDMDAGTATLYRNNVLIGTLASGLTGTIYPCCSGNASTATSFTANFGATAFTYTPPSGFVGLSDGVTEPATGFTSTNFGSATQRRTQPVTGFSSTQLGTPLTLAAQIEQATGFKPTQLGTPLAVVAQIEQATGFSSTQFGAPKFGITAQATGVNAAPYFGTPTLIFSAVGFNCTYFGLPVAPSNPVATGFLATRFGAITSRNANIQFDFGPATNFGTPSTPFDQTQTATGSDTTAFPTPVALVVTATPTGRTVPARGSRGTAFGVETALRTFTGIATGLQAIHFGAPAYHAPQTDAASGVSSTQFGTPVAVLGPHDYAPGAAGFKGTHFGHAVVGMTVNPFGFQRTRFGVPGYSLPGAHRAYGLNNQPGFGHPSARSEFRYPATGAAPSTRLGTPHATITHKARMTAPRTRFGVPLVKRNPTC